MLIIKDILFSLIAIFIASCVHEYPKVFVYKFLVHPIHRGRFKISMNPLRYIDPFGVICFVFIGTGWQRPLEYNQGYLRDKEKGLLAISLTGLLSNLLFITILMPIALVLGDASLDLHAFLTTLLVANAAIFVVNLLPVPPLDMARIIQAFKPHVYFRFIQYEKMIQAFFILAIAIGFVNQLVALFYNAYIVSIFKLIS